MGKKLIFIYGAFNLPPNDAMRLTKLLISIKRNVLHYENKFTKTFRPTLVSRIEVPVRLFFFAFYPQPVCLIWVYVFNIFFLKGIACLPIWDMYACKRQGKDKKFCLFE
jgi:hypothetical protein